MILFNVVMWMHGTMHLSKTHKLYSTSEKNKNTLGTEYLRGKTDSYKRIKLHYKCKLISLKSLGVSLKSNKMYNIKAMEAV